MGILIYLQLYMFSLYINPKIKHHFDFSCRGFQTGLMDTVDVLMDTVDVLMVTVNLLMDTMAGVIINPFWFNSYEIEQDVIPFYYYPIRRLWAY